MNEKSKDRSKDRKRDRKRKNETDVNTKSLRENPEPKTERERRKKTTRKRDNVNRKFTRHSFSTQNIIVSNGSQ